MTALQPVGDVAFTLDAMLDAPPLHETARFSDADSAARDAILGGIARLCDEVVAPLRAPADRAGATLENGVVRAAPGYAGAYAALGGGGWIGLAADPAHGGLGLPQTFAVIAQEMLAGADLSLANAALLTNGHIEALETHAPDHLRAICLPKLIGGAWTGTMNLTEPQAGTDVGALTTRAEPDGAGRYRLTGQKIYITWGEHDLTENILHLVLARLPDAPPGARGVSLFLAPKVLFDGEGRLGSRNALRAVSLERKMGLHGSPTAVMAYEGATAWLIGEPDRGLPAMFTMMNNARLNVAAQGVGIAEAAFRAALAYARERVQGRTPLGAGPIEGHADVRRMLLRMRTLTMAARAVAYGCGVALDLARAAPEGERDGWAARGAFLTPIAKAFCTDVGCAVASLGVQVHGGMGYVEDGGAAQYLRDVRITPIYEGTNGVQAMDLVGRKLAGGGAAARALLADLARAPGGAALAAAREALAAATDWMLAAPAVDRQAGAAEYLEAWGLTLGGAALARGAAADPARAPFWAFFAARELPRVGALCAAATDGAAGLYALDAEGLGR